MNTNLAQINILVKIDESFDISYSFTDPKSKKHHDWVKKCILHLDAPTFCVFELETKTVKNGWSMKQLLANGTPLVPHEMSPFGVSVNTFFRDAPDTDYKFFITYQNIISNKSLFFDPQELNIPPNDDCPPK